MYSQKVMQLFKNPHNWGRLEHPTVVGQAGNRVCGDVLKLYLKIKDSTIQDIKFETLGCAAAIATSSMITDLVKGKTIQEAAGITKDDIAESLEGLPPIKMHCSVLAIEALQQALEKFNKLKK